MEEWDWHWRLTWKNLEGSGCAINIVSKGKLIIGSFLLLAGLAIFIEPDIIQYILATILTVSGTATIVGAIRDRITNRGAHFIRRDDDAS